MDGHSRSAVSDPLLRPFAIRGHRFRNRIVSTSHAAMLDDQGMPADRYRAYHARKARGGLAMTMIGGSAMASPESTWGGGQLDLTDDRVIPYLTTLAEEVHGHGTLVMSQVSHLGRRASSAAMRGASVLAPSPVRETRSRSFPRAMDEADIERIVADYASAARRCRDGGLDGVETVTGGHLIGQFLSPASNKRTDRWGGSVANRAAFGLRVHEAIRRAVGDDMLIGIRFVIDEGDEHGLGLEECIEIARLFEAEGHIDFFNAIYGRMDSDHWLSEHNMPGLFQRSAPFLERMQTFRSEISLPLIHAAAIRDTATARHAVVEGIVDLVGMTRAHFADPDIVSRLARGEEDRIRPCVGASYCLLRKVNCIHNPSTGNELDVPDRIEPAQHPGKAVVVGGGPAGLEAARVLAERGHRVILFEATAELGGQVRIAARAEERRDLIGIVDWREAELARLDVDIRLNAYVEADDVMAEAPDVVVIASGGLPDLDWLRGAEFCDTTWDVLGGSVAAAETAIVYDGTGRQPAPSAALALARAGTSVTFVTPDDAVAVEMPYPDRVGFRKRLAEMTVDRRPELRLVKVQRQAKGLSATFVHELTGAEVEFSANRVVVEHGTLPDDSLYDALLSGAQAAGDDAGKPMPRCELHRIGDAVSSRDVYSSIREAFVCCRVL
ncbi:oxidoreductase [Roseivivax sediminis]|uniref:2,4-dienoyl-CoA reductase n=1 Tax=Roseivivax sediminis TaxID=936889 RepID=A0A1I1T9B8_9RHOB|nr:FAD-dependent oxidoreductase [Roseivivax sediminis]SFD55196.1 2,4-dienoyl-CoA reductase [Roseivivax sediminis]